MPLNEFIGDAIENVKIYALDGYLTDRNSGKVVEDGVFKNIEFGTKEELSKLIPQYESSWNTDRKDEKVWKFKLRYIENQNRDIRDADPKERYMDIEFTQFMEDVVNAKRVHKEKPFQYHMYVPGDLNRADFEEAVQEFCDRENCSYSLINQAPEAPSPQFYSENMKLMYPTVKDYEALKKNPKKLDIAKHLFEKQWNQKFDENNQDDIDDLVLLYNEYVEELREWKPVEVKLTLNETGEDSDDEDAEELKEDSVKDEEVNEDNLGITLIGNLYTDVAKVKALIGKYGLAKCIDSVGEISEKDKSYYATIKRLRELARDPIKDSDTLEKALLELRELGRNFIKEISNSEEKEIYAQLYELGIDIIQKGEQEISKAKDENKNVAKESICKKFEAIGNYLDKLSKVAVNPSAGTKLTALSKEFYRAFERNRKY